MNCSVLVLVGAYNGETYLKEQLESILNNSVNNIDVVLSDDGSTDNTVSISKHFSEHWEKGDFAIVEGPQKGFAANFLHLIVNYGQEHEYVAFSDQDDIWDPDKLEVAIEWLRQFSDRPALYCSRTRYVDEQGQFLRLSPLFSKPPDIRNALVQSIAGGNTMVMNRPAAQLLAKACQNEPVVTHDWWAYLVIVACGGIVHYDPVPHIGYRQHASNLFGANDTTQARLKRVIELFHGRFAGWTDANLAGLLAIETLLTDESRELVHLVETMRSAKFPKRIVLFARSGLYRQTVLGTLGLVVAVTCGLF